MSSVELTEVVVKRKKGRPRKEPQISNVDEEGKQEVEKKKRGRKKKEVIVEEVKVKKKRGRKPTVKYFSSSIRKKFPLTTVIQDSNNFILHIDIKDKARSSVDTVTYDSAAQPNENAVDFLQANTNLTADSTIEKLVFEGDDDEESNTFEDLKEMDLRELYEKKIHSREEQEKLLIKRMEELKKDENFLQQVLQAKAEKQCEPIQNVRNQEDMQSDNRKKGYFELLYKFIHNTDWLQSTDVCCWWCCHTFQTTPLGLPQYYNKKISKFRVKGVFCSFSCMAAYNNETSKNKKEYLIKFLYAKLTGESVTSSIIPAPPRCTLKMFGGELTIEEFRNSFKEHKIFKMVEYPMYISKDYVEEIDIANVKSANTKIFDDRAFSKVINLDDKRVQDARYRLSTQIEKTTVTIGNTIDKFINIS